MASIDDHASDIEELDRDIALKMRKPELPLTGFCWNCSEETHGVFCSPECQQDHEQRTRFNR